jgi:protease PrsW
MRPTVSPPSRHLPALAQADFASVGVLLLFVMAAYAVEAWARPTFSPTGLVLVGLAMSLIPAAVWLAFFYRRDHLEPEPKGLVFRVFLLGVLLAAAVGIPVVEEFFAVRSWLYHNSLTHLMGGILVIGFTQEFLKFAAVRFFVYDAADFDEPLDGIIYATAAGVGYATLLNIHFIIESGGADLGSAAVRIVFTALAHASFAGVMGYFVGISKFNPDLSIGWMSAGVVFAAVLNGLFFYLRGELAQGGTNLATPTLFGQWGSLALAILLTLSVTWAITRAMSLQTGEGEVQAHD